MEEKLTIIAATKNQHKIAEFRSIFSAIPAGEAHVISEDEAVRSYAAGAVRTYTAPEETGSTFAANAFIKAAGIYRFLREFFPSARDGDILIAADDSGLSVSALQGAPGVLSARYASDTGENASDSENVAKLLCNMEAVPDQKRGAYFTCAIAAILIRKAGGPVEIFTAAGHLPGLIAREPRGSHGFGYDPVLYLPEYGKCVAELDPAQKDAISHRGKALRRLADQCYGNYSNV